MSPSAPKVIYDCNIFVQSLINLNGPAARCVQKVNLAIRTNSQFIVSRDRHLLMLADSTRKEGQDFQSRFPRIRVIDPVALLKGLERDSLPPNTVAPHE